MGKSFEGYTIEITKNDQPYQVWQIAPDLPVYGLLGRKTEDGGQTDFEIIDYSRM